MKAFIDRLIIVSTSAVRSSKQFICRRPARGGVKKPRPRGCSYKEALMPGITDRANDFGTTLRGSMKRPSVSLAAFFLLSVLFLSNAYAAVVEIRFGSARTWDPNSLPGSWAISFHPEFVSSEYEMHQISLNFSAGEYVWFEIGMANVDRPASLLMDKIGLTGPSGEITIFNSGFESGVAGWSAWGGRYPEGEFTLSAESYEGSRAGKLTLPSTGTYSLHTQTPVAITQGGTYTLSVYTRVQEEAREIPPDILFATEEGNQWVYEGNVRREFTEIDDFSFRRDTFKQSILQNGSPIGYEWYEVWKGYTLFWGTSENSGTYKFSEGLLVGWIPVAAGESKRSLAWVMGYNTEVDLTATFLGTEPVPLDFDTFEAYRFRYHFTFTGPGGTAVTTYDWWFVPYIGVVKQQSAGGAQRALSFLILGGRVSEVSDNDLDLFLDYKELTTYHTDPLRGDTDLDGCLDGVEYFGGRNPLVQDPEGDLNMDCAFGLQDAILGFRSLAGYEDADGVKAGADLTGDKRIGLGEVIYVLHKISGLR